MLEQLKSFFVLLYIYVCGIRFYSTCMYPCGEEIQSFVVKTIQGHEITFRFYRENIVFTKYIFGRLRRVENIVYLVTAEFHEDAPFEIQQYSGVKMYINSSWLFFRNEDSISKALLNAYVDFITLEFERHQKG